MKNKKPILVGLTGGIGSGKSTIAKVFSVLGIPVYEADQRAKTLMVSDQELVSNIINYFGEKSYLGGKPNRDFLAKEIFSNPNKLDALNSIVHPAVALDFEKWIQKYEDKPYLIKEAALLFETGSYQKLDFNFLVISPMELRITRIKQRDPFRSEEEINNIINKQWVDSRKRKLASGQINNDEMELIIPQILRIHEGLVANHSQ